MNLLYLYAYHIIIPISSGGGNMDEKILWAILIVLNAIWLATFVFALIHNAIINAKSDLKDNLGDRDYFSVISLFCAIIDGIAIFCGLILWVSTLL